MKRFFSVLAKILLKNWHLKLIALLFAVILWSYAMVTVQPARKLIVDEVPIRVVGMDELEAKRLTISGGMEDIIDSVTVTVEAVQSQHKYISADNVQAVIDLSAINSVGEAEVRISAGTEYGRVLGVSPSRQTLNIETLLAREIPVRAELVGQAAEGYYVNEPTVKQTLTIQGAKSTVQRVAEGTVQVKRDGLRNSYKESQEVILWTSEGERVSTDALTSGLPTTVVGVEVYPTKMVRIDTQSLINSIQNVAAGYQVTGVEFSDNAHSLEVAAPKELLDTISLLQADPIDAHGADEGFLTTAKVQVAEGAILTQTDTVRVYVKISEIQQTKTFQNVAIELINDGNYKAQLTPARTDVTVSGGISAVKEIRADDMRLYVDVSALSPGTYTLPIKYDLPEGLLSSGMLLKDTAVTVEVRG